jgi:hypothetical protein
MWRFISSNARASLASATRAAVPAARRRPARQLVDAILSRRKLDQRDIRILAHTFENNARAVGRNIKAVEGLARP